VTEGVATGVFVDARVPYGFLDRFLNRAFACIPASNDACLFFFRQGCGGENVLPAPFAIHVGIFAGEGVRQAHLPEAVFQVTVVDLLHFEQMRLERFDQGGRQDGDAVFFPFAVVNSDGQVFHIQIFDTQLHTLGHADAAAVHHLSH